MSPEGLSVLRLLPPCSPDASWLSLAVESRWELSLLSLAVPSFAELNLPEVLFVFSPLALALSSDCLGMLVILTALSKTSELVGELESDPELLELPFLVLFEECLISRSTLAADSLEELALSRPISLLLGSNVFPVPGVPPVGVELYWEEFEWSATSLESFTLVVSGLNVDNVLFVTPVRKDDVFVDAFVSDGVSVTCSVNTGVPVVVLSTRSVAFEVASTVDGAVSAVGIKTVVSVETWAFDTLIDEAVFDVFRAVEVLTTA